MRAKSSPPPSARAGRAVASAASVDEALAAIASSRPDLVISDIAMPDKDGFDLVRMLRDLPAKDGSLIPALALTAYAREEDHQRALDAGFQFHLAKPVNPGALIRAISQLKIPVVTDGERTSRSPGSTRRPPPRDCTAAAIHEANGGV